MERMGITHEETINNLKQANIALEQQRKKVEVLLTLLIPHLDTFTAADCRILFAADGDHQENN